ncbi:MAG: hypothetical protein J0M26_06395 [Planctomycetes bacterium]|nr:hypothetical protein [Planctomycetota bacterium]
MTIGALKKESLDSMDARVLNHLHRCRNAGQIAVRSPAKSDDDWFRIPNLSYEPIYDYRELLETIQSSRARTFFHLAILVLGAIVALAIARLGFLSFFFVCLVGLIPVYVALAASFNQWRSALLQLKEWESQVPEELPMDAVHPVEIHWWSLVRQGYLPLAAKRYWDNSIGLSGRPWRLLQNQETGEYIPVVDVKLGESPLSKSIAMEYRIFLLALSKLIQENEGHQIRWGVVIELGTRKCVAIPLQSTEIENVPELVAAAKNWFTSHDVLEFVEPPPGRCLNCPYAVRRSEKVKLSIEGETITPNLFDLPKVLPILYQRDLIPSETDPDVGEEATEFKTWLSNSPRGHRSFHCDCGDLFKWIPIHQQWIQHVDNLRAIYLSWKSRK